jgi:hypothetical protein
MSANELPHLFAGELQFRRYSDSSTQGPQVVFGLADREALQAFVGLEGRRVMAVLVLVGDDEQPEPPKASKPLKEGPRRKLGPICLWLVERCKEAAFQQWAANREGLPMPTESIAADFCRRACGVESRKEIDGNADAEARFESLIRKPWGRHSKRLAQPT